MFRRYIVLVFVLAAVGIVSGGNAQNNAHAQKEPKWIEGKFLVRVQRPYLSDAGHVVLAYTVTNNSGSDVKIDFVDEPVLDVVPHRPARVFLKLRSSQTYVQVSPKDNRVYFPKELLPADLPVDFKIVVGKHHDASTSWFSSKTEDDKERDAIRDELENLENIVVFIPDRRLKIEFPIRK
jgi:hypothetical protein